MRNDLTCYTVASKLILFITLSIVALIALSLAKESLSMSVLMMSIVILLIAGVNSMSSHGSLYKWSIWEYIVLVLYIIIILEVSLLAYMYEW